MKRYRFTLNLAIILLAVSFVITPVFAEQPSKAPLLPALERDMPPGRGFIPPRMDLSHLTGQKLPAQMKVAATPAQWDWRESGMVTSVKNQGNCGSCYAFAALGNMESALLIAGAGTYNFSENNAKECNWYGTSCDGGSYKKMANWLSKTGVVLESCDPYVASDVACNSGCTYIKTLLEWCIVCDGVVPSTEVLKQYIYDHGPVYTSMYTGDASDPAWDTEYGYYDGSYTMYYTGDYPTNHAVLIVGWDDALVHAGGTGGWIVKNSWGTSWGGTCGYGTEGGYFTIAYGSAGIGKYSSFIANWQDYASSDDILFYDEGGMSNNWGYNDNTAFGMSKFIVPSNAYITCVDFWTNDVTTDVDIWVFDGFTGAALTDLLDSKLDLSFAEAGYHSVALDLPPYVTAGEDVYVSIRFTNTSYQYPVATCDVGTIEPATTYMSHYGSAGTWLDMGTDYSNDVAIRIRTSPEVGVAGIQEELPDGFRLEQNYPNPFNPHTTIAYSLERRSQVEIAVYNLLGQRITTLVNRDMPAGEHEVTWDGTDSRGGTVSSGVYFYRIQAGDFSASEKMLLLK